MEASALRAPAAFGRRSAPLLLRMRSDDQLVALFRLGNEDAFGVIHDRYRQRLFAYARQMLSGSASDAEDALQDVFVRAYNALRADDRPVTLRAWLYRVAHNRCIDQIRRASAPTYNVVELPDNVRSLNGGWDPIAEAERRDDLKRLIADVRELPEQQRSALLMRELEGLSYQELADAMQVSVPAIKSLLVRARVGLTDAQQARDTACTEIRCDLAGAHARGVRASARARRHMRECDDCRDYRQTLRAVERGLAALQPPAGLWATVLQAVGIGGSSAAAGGSAVAGGGAVVGAGSGGVALGGIAAATTAKVAAVVCCAAVLGGGAAELKQHTTPPGSRSTAQKNTRTATSRVVSSTAVAAAITRAVSPVAAAAAAVTTHVNTRGHRDADHTMIHATAVSTPTLAPATTLIGDEEDRAAASAAGAALAPDEVPVATPTTTAAPSAAPATAGSPTVIASTGAPSASATSAVGSATPAPAASTPTSSAGAPGATTTAPPAPGAVPATGSGGASAPAG